MENKGVGIKKRWDPLKKPNKVYPFIKSEGLNLHSKSGFTLAHCLMISLSVAITMSVKCFDDYEGEAQAVCLHLRALQLPDINSSSFLDAFSTFFWLLSSMRGNG